MNKNATWTCSKCGTKVAATVPPEICENKIDDVPCGGVDWSLDDRLPASVPETLDS